MGVAPGGAEPEEDATTKIKKTFGRWTSRLSDAIKSKTHNLRGSGEPGPDAPPAAEQAPAPEVPAEAPAQAAPARSAATTWAQPKHTLDRVVLEVGEGQAHKAKQVLTRKSIREADIEGDRLEFDCASNRLGPLLKTLVDMKVDIYLLQRTTGETIGRQGYT